MEKRYINLETLEQQRDEIVQQDAVAQQIDQIENDNSQSIFPDSATENETEIQRDSFGMLADQLGAIVFDGSSEGIWLRSMVRRLMMISDIGVRRGLHGNPQDESWRVMNIQKGIAVDEQVFVWESEAISHAVEWLSSESLKNRILKESVDLTRTS